MNADLTVVIPNYNNAKYIRTGIESILNQSLLPREIIVVDDSSTDNSREILTELANRSPLLTNIFLKKNGGVSNARNVGLSECNTTYVTFMDADDFYFNKDKLKLEMEIIKRLENQRKDVLAYSVTASVSEQGELIQNSYNTHWRKGQFLRGNAKLSLISLVKQGRIPRDYIIKADVLRRVGAYSFYENFYEDLDLLMRLGMAGVWFECTYEYGTGYRSTPSGLSARPKQAHQKMRREIAQFYYNKLSVKEKSLCLAMMGYNKLWESLKMKILVPIKNRLVQWRDAI